MAQAHRELQPGEHVTWSYGAGHATGHVVEKLTEDRKLGSRVFRASPDEPKYLVRNDTSGKEAVRKAEALHRVDEPGVGTPPPPIESEEGGDGGRGVTRESAMAAREKIKDVVSVPGRGESIEMGDVGEKEDASFSPSEEEMQAPDDEAAIESLPTDQEVLAQAEKEAMEEGVKAMDVTGMGDEEGEKEDRTYEPSKDELARSDIADDKVLSEMPSDEELIKQADKENRQAAVEAGTLAS
ncbi:hypothetical protein KP509_13G075400 [Ceratopteris richardii]|uniref:Hypervirulence associated protein TUDOR domain-containing protein n=1 Tax=Ceratopteris richardii TaxID=49495 RepID=A0A8T2TK25_CERRI|nr:hypothetical protein KP509_13G075400 [Ceratopteris richardii]